jgi:tRNA nucleotidyltransferase/poly(A) polymerase
MNSAKELFTGVKNLVLSEIPSSKIYLIGESLRDSLSGKKPSVFEFFIETKDTEKFEEFQPRLSVFKNIKVTCGKKINADKEILTVNSLYLDINDILNGVDNVQCFNNGLRDFNKGVIRITEQAKLNFDENPSIVFNILNTIDETGFYIDPNTTYFLFNKRNVFHKIEKRKIFNFLKDILKKNHPRKFVSYLNTFGLSKELFGVNLIESPVVNHLKHNDVYELFSVLFDNIELNELESFLVEKCGFLLRDVENVIRVSKIIRNIEDESDTQVNMILKQVDKNRVVSMCRLLKAMNYKTLAKNVRKQKSRLFVKTELCVDERAIRVAFGIDNINEINNLLELAKKKIISNPEFNDTSKILLYLNSERTKLCQDQDQTS